MFLWIRPVSSKFNGTLEILVSKLLIYAPLKKFGSKWYKHSVNRKCFVTVWIYMITINGTWQINSIKYWKLIFATHFGYVASGNSRLHQASDWSRDKRRGRRLIASSHACDSWKRRPSFLFRAGCSTRSQMAFRTPLLNYLSSLSKMTTSSGLKEWLEALQWL